MRILLDCRSLLADRSKGAALHFILSCVRVLARERGVEWLFLLDKRQAESFPADIGLQLPVAGTIPGVIGRKLWVGWQLPRIVKKHQVDLVMEAREIAAAPGVADERYAPLAGEEKEGVRQVYAGGKEYFLADISCAGPEEIVGLLKAFSLFKKRQRSNMQLVLAGGGLSGAPDGGPDGGRTGERGLGLARGKGGVPGQRPGIAPARGMNSALARKLDTYKYRSDIHFYGGYEGAGAGDEPGEGEWRKLVAAAYVFILPAGTDSRGLMMLNAWKAESPVVVIGAADPASPLEEGGETAEAAKGGDAAEGKNEMGDAVLYARPGDPSSLAGLLMSLYTNEGLRADLIGKGRLRLRSFGWARSAGQVWEGILRATNRQ